MTTPASAPPIVTIRGATAGLTVFAGAVHLMVGAQRGALWSSEATALASWGVVQIVLGVALVVTAERWVWWGVSIAGTLGAAAWLVTRTLGYPFGPIIATPPVRGVEIAVAVAQLVSSALAGAVVLSETRRAGFHGLSFENLTVVVIAAAALPGIAASSWLEGYAFDPALGTMHIHDTTTTSGSTTMTLAERQQLGTELDRVTALALEHPTLAAAEAAGLVVSGAAALGIGVQAFDPSLSVESPFDISRPRAWIYASDDPAAPVVGVLYDVIGEDPPTGFAGTDDAWHLHPGECDVPLPDGSTLVVPIDPAVTGNDCEPVNGELNNRVHWMLRVWAVPGWASPLGVFAHDHAGLPAR